MDFDEWSRRFGTRHDVSAYVTHLTRRFDDLLNILRERIVRGGDGMVLGGERAVCFMDAPLRAVAECVRYEEEKRSGRYQGGGIAFPKPYVFAKGARPAIYEKREKAERLLDLTELWRVVTFDLERPDSEGGIVDWTHERERRHRGDFPFDPEQATIVLPGPPEWKRLVRELSAEDLAAFTGVTMLRGVARRFKAT